MRNRLLPFCAFAVCLAWVSPAAAQEIVHALSGTVVNVDSQARTIRVQTNDGSEGLFNFPAQKSTEVDFDRDAKARTTPVTSFNKQNEQVVVFYYGNGNTRTAVAVQDLGTGPFSTVEGTVTKSNKRQHTLAVKDASGKVHSFAIDPKAVADTTEGAVSAEKFEPQKGDNVRVIATQATSGNGTAMFVRD